MGTADELCPEALSPLYLFAFIGGYDFNGFLPYFSSCCVASSPNSSSSSDTRSGKIKEMNLKMI
jgi:hypothetical protein